jgi:hypothetical protein
MGCVANFREIVNILEILAGISEEKKPLERLAWGIILSRILKYYMMLHFWFFHVDRDVA